jgi:hypothetical protein
MFAIKLLTFSCFLRVHPHLMKILYQKLLSIDFLKPQAFATALTPTSMLQLFRIFFDEILTELKSHERFCLEEY